jgi:quercetin dioxygenase-like cupin family protein
MDAQPSAPAVERIRRGDVVQVKPGEWHWRGAAPDRLMTHLSLSEGDTELG